MLIASFHTTGSAVAQIFILGAIGYFLVRRNILGDCGLDALSRLVMEVTLPVMIFCQLLKDFSFSRYADWWIFPLSSLLITASGLLIGVLFTGFFKGQQHKLQFLSLAAFQNSGYLPLVLIAALFSPDKAGPVFVYLFLFLLGFNLTIFSLGVYMLTFYKDKKFQLASLASPPVIAVLATLVLIALGLDKFIPEVVVKPLRLIGDSTMALAMLVVGGNLAQINLGEVDKKAVFLMLLSKMVILPLAGLWLILKLRLPELIGILILIELAMPPATTLSVIIRHYKKEDLLISQGIFFGHLFGILTIPLFLGLYFALVVIK